MWFWKTCELEVCQRTLWSCKFHVHWLKTKPSCVCQNVDPVCDRCPPPRGGSFHIFNFTYILNFSVSSLSEWYLLIHVWLQLCLQFYHSLCSYLSLPFCCILSVLSTNVFFKALEKVRAVYSLTQWIGEAWKNKILFTRFWVLILQDNPAVSVARLSANRLNSIELFWLMLDAISLFSCIKTMPWNHAPALSSSNLPWFPSFYTQYFFSFWRFFLHPLYLFRLRLCCFC